MSQEAFTRVLHYLLRYSLSDVRKHWMSTSPNAFVEKRQIVNVAIVVNAPVDYWI